MAKRPSVQEILQAARREGPTPSPPVETPSGEPATTPVPQAETRPGGPRPRLSLQEKLDEARARREARSTAATPPARPRLTLQEKLAKARAEREARVGVAPGEARPTPAARLTLQEKLAKARAEREARAAGPAAAPSTAAIATDSPSGGPPPRLSLQEKLAAARAKQAAPAPAPPPTVASAPDSAAPGRLSLQEKLAAARSGKSAPPPAPAKASPKNASEVPARPLSMQEKLAAARSGGATTPIPASVLPASPGTGQDGKAMSVRDKLAAARSGGATTPAAPASAPAPITPAASAKAMSVKDKLAAARGHSPAPAEAPPESTTTAPAPARLPSADRALPALAEMSDPRDLAEALRRTGARKAAESAAAPADAKAPGRPATFVPPDPAARAAVPEAPLERPTRSQVRVDRRGLLVYASWWVVIAWVALAATIGLLSMMVLRFLFPNVSPEPPSTVKVGFPSDYKPGEVSERFKDRGGFWVVRDRDAKGGEVLYALQACCTHLGCPPSWLPGERKFKCPCHGSGFTRDGVNFEGPAPRPLERYKIGLADDGSIVVDKGQTFRKDLDQWSDPDSFLAV